MTKANFGMIGLGTMGRNFLLNVAEHGIPALGFDRDGAKCALLEEEGASQPVRAAADLHALLEGLETPRKIMLLVPAGPIVDAVIDELVPVVDPGDVIIDGGNSHFPDTERREQLLRQKGIAFLGVGVSGGEEGARHGASIMVGGDPAVYEGVRPVFEAVSAKVGDEPCAAHVGLGSAGHFVKMVHNGIEYGLMQLIAETYDLLSQGAAMPADEIGDLLGEWNAGALHSFLIEITSTVLRKADPETGRHLVDVILDTAGQKGTGKWTSVVALDMGIPIPTIDAAVTMRQLSACKEERVAASRLLDLRSATRRVNVDIDAVRDGLHLAFLITYAQGLALLHAASAEKAYDLDLVEISRIWRGGCIIRARLLEDIRKAYAAEPALSNLMLSPAVTEMVKGEYAALRTAVGHFRDAELPAMAHATALDHLTAFASERLPANLIQAQRDYFGAHTYQRIDREGIFHTPDWEA